MNKLASIVLLIASVASAQIITIIDNGVERKISLPSAPNGVNARAIQTEQKSIMVAFKKGAAVDIAAFSSQYNLVLTKKLSIGYYIFKNKSSLSDITLISLIQKENRARLKTIRPNWGFNNMPR
ncbi:MAG TPA: hypothetical protein ENL00_03260 [Nitratifractor sp.]|nr:hypothetical protein [Nitratifractor sp.]HHD74822.1 hypothetical protein [Nitratifractor sp.]